jgi:hypothetical protein
VGKLIRNVAAVLLATSAVAAGAQPTDASPAQWREWALGDIEAATNDFRQSHPGMFDPANPAFPAQLQRAHDAAAKAAETATGPAGFALALYVYSAQMRDGHAQVYPVGIDLPLEWTGIIPVRRANRTWVFLSEVPGVPKGAEVTSCDGQKIDDYLLQHVFLTAGRPAEAGQWWQFTPSLFTRTDASKADRPARCTFRMQNGAELERALEWRPAPDDMSKRRRVALDGEPNPLTLTEPQSGIFHIGLSDFAPDTEGLKAWDRLLADLKSRDADLRRARAIILDLRYNNGGSSNWPKLVAEQLWGKDATDTRLDNYFKGVEIWWLAEPGNIHRFEKREAELRKIGDKNAADFVHGELAHMKSALAEGRRFYVERDPPGKVFPPNAEPKPLPPVYVMMPPSCASACLDAVDLFHLFPGVTLIGAPTSGDSTCLEVVQDDLPSGHAKISIPTKISVGRPRGSGEVYKPRIEVDELDWTVPVIVNAVEQDLRSRGAQLSGATLPPIA